MSHDKLFIPGPVEVSEKTWAAFRRPMIGHRSEAFRALYRSVHPRLQVLFGTKQPVFLSTFSSFSAVPIPMDELGIHVLLTGSQKALALPPGFSLFSVSEKAFARAEKQKDRGNYFDFLEFKKNQEDDMTPTTPSIAHIHALESKLDDIFGEGLTSRYARHASTNVLVHD